SKNDFFPLSQFVLQFFGRRIGTTSYFDFVPTGFAKRAPFHFNLGICTFFLAEIFQLEEQLQLIEVPHHMMQLLLKEYLSKRGELTTLDLFLKEKMALTPTFFKDLSTEQIDIFQK